MNYNQYDPSSSFSQYPYQSQPPINPYYYQQAPQVIKPKKPRRVFSSTETVFAWIVYVLAYLFCLSVPINKNPLGAFVVIVLMFSSTFVVMLIKGRKLQIMPLLVGISAVVISTGLILTANGLLHFFAFLYSLVAYCYFLYGMSGDRLFRFTDGVVIDFVKAVFVMPFCSFTELFRVIFSSKSNKSGRLILKILIGVAITIVPTVVIIALLSYDSGFSDLMSRIFNFENFDIFKHITSLSFAFPIGACVYGLYISSTDNKCKNILTTESCENKLRKIRIAPVITVLTAVIPILFIYVVFFISQWQYYVSGFTGTLPEDFSYAQYAREGFFQLCVVSVINLVILIIVSLFMKRRDNKPTIILKLLSIIISLFTLVLISTAVAKMVMYIDCYGLTPKRVYASWFMLVLALVFVLIIFKQFIRRLKLIALSLSALVLLFGVLTLSNVDAVIAQYNFDRYVDGSLNTVDIDAMEELGDAAIPQLVELANILDEKNGTDIVMDPIDMYDDSMYGKLSRVLHEKANELITQDTYHSDSVWSFTVPSAKAEEALRSSAFFADEK